MGISGELANDMQKPARGRPDDGVIRKLIDLCKQVRGAKNIALTPNPLEKSHLPANPDRGAAITLLSLADVEGVNNLAPGNAAREHKGA